MYPDPDNLVARLTEHHKVTSLVVLRASGSVLRCIGGGVTVDTRRDTRRSCSLSLLDVDGVLQSKVTPYGVEATVSQTLLWDDGASWTVPLGVFVLSDPVYEEDQGGVSCSVDGEDLSRRVKRAGRTYPVEIASSSTLTAAVRALIGPVYPTNTITIEGRDPTVGVALRYLEGPNEDSWADAVNLAAGQGYDLFFDVTGQIVLRPFPTAEKVARPDMFYTPGPIISGRVAGGDAAAFSGVIAVAQSASGQVLRAEVWDTNPSSPTYIYGTFGRVPYWIELPGVSTQEQVNAAARATLAKVTGASRALEWQQVPNPATDAWDVAAVSFPGLGVARANVIVDSTTIPLGLSTQTVRARDGRWL